jgi:hypothetical protein
MMEGANRLQQVAIHTHEMARRTRALVIEGAEADEDEEVTID